jgi:hypothetical protein
MFVGKSFSGSGRTGVASRFSKIALAAIIAVLATGCAHSTVTGMSQPHTPGAIPHDAWGNPIIVSQNTR